MSKEQNSYAKMSMAIIGEAMDMSRKSAIKPYKGYYGFNKKGFFEIRSDEELEQLKLLEEHV